MKHVFPVMFAMFFYTSCTYNNIEETYPGCDTAQVTYQKVQELLDINCVSCHGSVTAFANVYLEDSEDVKAEALGGTLLAVIEHQPGYEPMPRNAPKLSDCNIAIIRKWIYEGANN